MCYIVFEKAKSRRRRVRRTSDCAEAAVRRGSIKKTVSESLF